MAKFVLRVSLETPRDHKTPTKLAVQEMVDSALDALVTTDDTPATAARGVVVRRARVRKVDLE